MARASSKGGSGAGWMSALKHAGVEVKTARSALATKGYLDTGNYALNWAISGRFLRGYPLGHTVEIFGDPSTGKSFLAARAIAMVQSAGGVALLDDAEGAYNDEHSQRIGIDVDALAHRRSATVKEHLDATVAFLKAIKELHPPAGLLVLDSLAQLSTEHEMEVMLDKRDMSKAAELKAFFRIVGNTLFDLPVVHLATNHTIAAIGQYNTRTTGGGGGPKFTASVRLDCRAVTKLKDQAGYLGTLCRVVVDKNRISTPWRETRMAIPFYQPISRASGLVDVLVQLGVLELHGHFIHYKGAKVGRYYADKQKFLKMDEVGEAILDQTPELLEEVDAQLEAGTLGVRLGLAPELTDGGPEAPDAEAE